MCAGDFELILQVTSTLWPDIKSQKISEYRFSLKWTKCSLRTNPNAVKTRQTPTFRQEEAQDSLPEEDGGGWPTWQADRPGPWAPPPQPGYVVSPHWSLASVVKASPHGSLI